MHLEPHRARRYPFQANIELSDVQSETQITGRTSDLSLFGCHVNAINPLAPEAKVHIRIAHRSVNFQALGRVVFARSDGGMEIVFTSIQPNDQLVLDECIAELRG